MPDRVTAPLARLGRAGRLARVGLCRASVLSLAVGVVLLATASAALAAPAFTQVGVAYPTGTNPTSVAFSPDGTLLATANEGGNTVSMFSVSTGGVLTSIATTATGAGPYSVAFSPNGTLLAVTNSNANTVSVFTVSAGGVLAQVGAPTATGIDPRIVAFSPNGGLLATARSMRIASS